MDNFKGLLAVSFGDMHISAAEEGHPNEMKFSGTLVRLDEPSTKAPNGSRGHKILIPKALAASKVKTLIGMGVNYSANLEQHAPTNKVGVIKKAWIEGNAIKVSGVIWKKDFPDAEKKLKQKNLGMSFEASDIDVEDQNADVWRLSNLCFTGAAILYKASAAYFKTDALAASAMSVKLIKTTNGGVNMAKEVKKNKPSVAASGTISINDLTTALAGVMKPVVDRLNDLNASQASLRASIEEAQIANISAKAKKVKAMDEEDDMDSSIDDDVESSEEVEAAKKAKADDEDMDDDDDDMDSAGSDDEDELEDLDDGSDIKETDDQELGKINSKIIKKNKGSKTTVSTEDDQHKNVTASAISKLNAKMDSIIASNEALQAENKQLKRQIKASKVELKAAGERVGRRSVPTSTMLGSLLAKNGIDANSISASSDEKIQPSELDAMFAAAGNLTIQQKFALKSEAAKLGIMDEGHVVKQ